MAYVAIGFLGSRMGFKVRMQLDLRHGLREQKGPRGPSSIAVHLLCLRSPASPTPRPL